MIIVPFVYFTLLLLFIVAKKRRFDVSAYVVSLYVVTSFYAILIDYNDLRSYETLRYEIGVVPTILYCLLLSLSIWPFYKLGSEKILSIGYHKDKSFNLIVYLFVSCFIFILFTSIGSIQNIYSGDIGELRDALHRGETITEPTLGGRLFQYITVVVYIFGGFSIIMQLFYFYSICYMDRSRLFNNVILLSSMSIIVIGILGIDRSKSVYWLVSYGFMLVMFWHHMSKRVQRKIFITSLTVFSVVLLYLSIVTISRFGDRSIGIEGGLITYAGQSFVNFCFFFDNLINRDLSLQRIFPLFYQLFVNSEINSSVELNAQISLLTGTSVGVFSTFIGDIMVASGKYASIIYVLLFAIISRFITNTKTSSMISFSQLILIYCAITVPMLGVFVHFYAGYSNTAALTFFVVYAVYLKVKRA